MTSQCTACASSQPERPETSHTELSIRQTSTISDANTIGNAEKPSQRRFRRCQNQELTPPPRRDRTGQPRVRRACTDSFALLFLDRSTSITEIFTQYRTAVIFTLSPACTSRSCSSRGLDSRRSSPGHPSTTPSISGTYHAPPTSPGSVMALFFSIPLVSY